MNKKIMDHEQVGWTILEERDEIINPAKQWPGWLDYHFTMYHNPTEDEALLRCWGNLSRDRSEVEKELEELRSRHPDRKFHLCKYTVQADYDIEVDE